MGGLSLGFALAFEEAEILGLDIDYWSVETYNLNLKRLGCFSRVQDLLKWKPRGDWDLIMGGVPCQPFSSANSRRRGKDHPLFPTFPLFFEIIVCLEPRVFLMENVKGLVSSTFRPLLTDQLSRLRKDYYISWKILNAADFGVPQRRERLFVIGIRRDLRRLPSFPPPSHSKRTAVTLRGKLQKWVTVREAIGDILLLFERSEVFKKHQVERISRERENKERHFGVMKFPDPLDEPSRTISSHTIQGTKRETIVIEIEEESQNFIPFLCFRRLTIRDCLRLQSFPDWWILPQGISKSKSYKIIGESVTPILAYKIARQIGKTLDWGLRRFDESLWDLPYVKRAFSFGGT